MERVKARRLCVFCGSAAGKGEKYKDLAREVGSFLAKNNVELVYGGASVGLMGLVADSVLENGGVVHGVIPQFMMEVELAHNNLTQLYVVDSMHERKFKMYELADAFLAMPGGIGTLDELCEIMTWLQLGRHGKPCGIFNHEKYFEHFIRQLDFMVEEGFLKKKDRERLYECDNMNDLQSFLSRGST